MTTKSIIIIGCSGQDGSFLADHLCRQLVETKIIGVIRRSASPNLWRLHHALDQPNFAIETADVTDIASLMNVFKSRKPKIIYNLAAQSFVPESWRQPQLTSQVTAIGALNVFEAARLVCPEAKIYQASSSEMFGNQSGALNENSQFKPVSPYAIAKTYAHQTAQAYAQGYGMHISTGILFNHESERRGIEFVTRKIAHTVAKIKIGKANTLTLGNIHSRRDWGFAGDYIQAMTMIMSKERPDNYVVATGQSHSVLDFVRTACEVAEIKSEEIIKVEDHLKRRNELSELIGDSSKIRTELGWKPSISFEQLVERMVIAEINNLLKGGK